MTPSSTVLVVLALEVQPVKSLPLNKVAREPILRRRRRCQHGITGIKDNDFACATLLKADERTGD
jgi:hypothetical protein